MTHHPLDIATPRQREGPTLTLCDAPAPQPGHICAFFDSDAEKYDTVAPWFIEAITAGDCVVNIVDQDRLDAHVNALSRANVPVRRAIETDRLRIRTTEETYLRDGRLDLEGVLDMVRETLAMAKTQGRCVRTCGEMDWIARVPHAFERAMEYEARVNYLLPGCDCTLLCVYDLERTPPGLIADILATHEYSIMNGRLRRNPKYVRPDDYLAMLRARRSA